MVSLCERTPPDKRAMIAQKSLVFSFIGALLSVVKN